LGGWYHASKFALEGLSDSLRNEVRGFGIDVIVIEPGATKSEWGDIALDSLLSVSGETAYKDLAVKTYQMFKKNALKKPEARVIAELVKEGIEAKNPKTRYWGGYMASTVLFLRRNLSDRLMDKVVMGQVK
jgi:short-subunit dehydrogenase